MYNGLIMKATLLLYCTRNWARVYLEQYLLSIGQMAIAGHMYDDILLEMTSCQMSVQIISCCESDLGLNCVRWVSAKCAAQMNDVSQIKG